MLVKKSLHPTPYTLHPRKGFTLIESLVAMSILALLAFSALGGLRASRAKADLDDGRASFLHALELARSRAATGAGGGDQSVAISSGDRFIFSDGTVTSTTFFPPFVSVNPAATTIVFNRMTAKSTASTTITLSNTSGTTTVAVTYDGAIIPR